MEVAAHLGLDIAIPPKTAIEAWPLWVSWDARLAVVPNPHDLRRWLQCDGSADEVNSVLLALAKLGRAGDTVDDHRAALLLAWALLPGANRVDFSVSSIEPSVPVSELVAAQLWIEVRSVSPGVGQVAARVLRQVRDQVLVAVNGYCFTTPIRAETWRHTTCDGGIAAAQLVAPTEAHDGEPADQLDALLKWARSASVIKEGDRLLLMGVVSAAASIGPTRRTRGPAGGLLGEPAEAVAFSLGISPRTVRRRVSNSIKALAAAADTYFAVVA